jgi:hypothetical protein
MPGRLLWRRSSYCTNVTCVEVAQRKDEAFFRDRKSPGHDLCVARSGLMHLLSCVKAPDNDRLAVRQQARNAAKIHNL